MILRKTMSCSHSLRPTSSNERQQLSAKELQTSPQRYACSVRQMTSLLPSINPIVCNFIYFSAFKY